MMISGQLDYLLKAVKNEISILVLKTPELSPDCLENTCANQDGQGPTSQLDINTKISILVLKPLGLNPGPLNMTFVNQDGQRPANLLSHRLELLNYSATCQLVKGDSPNNHQIATDLVPLRI